MPEKGQRVRLKDTPIIATVVDVRLKGERRGVPALFVENKRDMVQIRWEHWDGKAVTPAYGWFGPNRLEVVE